MGYRKSFKVGGVRINTSSKGIGYSVGGKGMRVTKRADGRVTRTLSVPRTGVSSTKTVGRGRRSSAGFGGALLGALLAGLKSGRKRH